MKKITAGFTLMELLLVMAIIGILTTVSVVILNPAHQLAKARDTQRASDLYSILSVVYQYTQDHSGALPDTDGDPLTSNFPTTLTCIGTGAGCFNLAGAGVVGETIVPVYVKNIPVDPKTGTAQNTGYLIMADQYNHLSASASGETREISVSK